MAKPTTLQLALRIEALTRRVETLERELRPPVTNTPPEQRRRNPCAHDAVEDATPLEQSWCATWT